MEIRRAETRDIPAINRLLEQVLMVHHIGRPDLFKNGGRKYNDEQLAALLTDDARPIFVYDDGGVVGYAFCIFQEHPHDNVLTPIRTLYIDDLCVDEACRGQHIGTALYAHVKQFAKDSGCYNLTLNVWTCNPPAMAFYEAQGLKPQKIGMEAIL